MKRKIFLTLTLCLVGILGFSQSKEITIEFMGNCGLHITDGITNIYVDFPYKSGAYNYMEFDEKELDSIKENSIFIFTHKHADHYSKKHLKKVLKEKNGHKYGVSNISDLENLSATIENFDIKAFKTKHSFFGIPFRHYSYLITWHNKRIYFSGDTTNPETVSKNKNIDWAFVPYWILNNSKEMGVEIDAKMFGIYHLYPSQISSVKKQCETIENYHPLIKQGEIIKIEF